MQTNFELVALVLAKPFNSTLSPGQMDLQVVASGRKLNLRRVLHWVAKRTQVSSQVHASKRKNILRQTILCFIG